MARLFAILIAVSMACVGTAEAFDPQGTPYRAVPHELAKTCDHYENRARFKPRGKRASMEVVFADSCSAALRSLVVALDTNPYQARRANEYLMRLSNLRATVIRINTERLFGKGAHPRAKPLRPALSGQKAMQARAGTITHAGEYLIAREMGVIAALRVWAKSAQFEVAAR